MPKMTTTAPGFTRLTAEPGKASVLVLQNPAGDEFGLWFGTVGQLRFGGIATIEAPGFDFGAGGTPVLAGTITVGKEAGEAAPPAAPPSHKDAPGAAKGVAGGKK